MGESISPGTPLLQGGRPQPHIPPSSPPQGRRWTAATSCPSSPPCRLLRGRWGCAEGMWGSRWPQGKHHPHPALSTPPPPRRPQHHGDGGFQNTGTAGGCRGDREERCKGGGGALGLVQGLRGLGAGPTGAMVKLGLAAIGARLLPM